MSAAVRQAPQAAVDRVEAQARDWVLRLAPGDDPEAEAQCAAWRAADPANEAAFAVASRAWQRIAETGTAIGGDWRGEAATLRNAPSARLGRIARSAPFRYGLPTAIAASVAALLLIPRATPAPDVQVATQTAQTRILALADGSRVTVGARSGVDVDYEGDARRVVLTGGQAFFEVARDPDRPFVVQAGTAEIRVLGTKFDVRRIGDEVRVSVLEGRVEVRRTGGGDARPVRVLVAGQRTDVRESGVDPVKPVTITPGEWRTGRLYYADAPLGEILADVERYSRAPIRAEDQVRRMRLTVSFRADDIGRFVGDVESALPVDAEVGPDGAIVLTRSR